MAMRLSKSRLKPYVWKRAVVTKDAEGGTYSDYVDPILIEAIIWPASGRLQAEMYGERLNYIENMLYQKGGPILKEGDGICYRVTALDKPDYKIISIKEYTEHYAIEIERIHND